MRIDVNIHTSDHEDKTASMLSHVIALLQRIAHLMSDLNVKVDTLVSEVADLPTIAQSVETLVDGLNAIIADLRNSTTDPAVLAKIDQANTTIDAAKARFVAAVQRGTPAG
jgi:uncharacterized protein YoxC